MRLGRGCERGDPGGASTLEPRPRREYQFYNVQFHARRTLLREVLCRSPSSSSDRPGLHVSPESKSLHFKRKSSPPLTICLGGLRRQLYPICGRFQGVYVQRRARFLRSNHRAILQNEPGRRGRLLQSVGGTSVLCRFAQCSCVRSDHEWCICSSKQHLQNRPGSTDPYRAAYQ
jgi:hypothetical protein